MKANKQRKHDEQMAAWEVGLKRLEERLGVEFRNRDLLREALTHRSYCNEHPEWQKHNERLEFMGDAVLEIIVTEHLFRKFQEEPEGKLTNWRSAIVNGATCSKIADSLGLLGITRMSSGERRKGGPKAAMYISANAIEALLGALYIDQGMGACRILVDHLFLRGMAATIAGFGDPKSTLQESVQERFGVTPQYNVLQARGPDHEKEWTIGLLLGDIQVATATGSSKKEAQIRAAETALATINTWEGRLLERGHCRSNKRLSGNGGGTR